MEIISVIEIVCNGFNGIESFIIKDEESKAEAVKQAEADFTAKALENGAKPEDIDSYIEEGNYDAGWGYNVNIVWS